MNMRRLVNQRNARPNTDAGENSSINKTKAIAPATISLTLRLKRHIP